MKDSIILMASSRSDGNTRKVVDHLISVHPETDLVDLKTKSIGYYDYQHRNQEDDFIVVVEEMLQYNTIIFATPVYWYTMSAELKTFFDRMSDLIQVRKDLGRQLKGKSMMVLSCGSERTEIPSFQIPFELSANYLHMNFVAYLHTWISGTEIPEAVKIQLRSFAESIPSHQPKQK